MVAAAGGASCPVVCEIPRCDGRRLPDEDLSCVPDVMDQSQFSAVGQIARRKEHRTIAVRGS